MLTYRIVRFGSCAKASGTVPVNSLFDKSLKENVKKKKQTITFCNEIDDNSMQ
jgi:hypothetical protein